MMRLSGATSISRLLRRSAMMIGYEHGAPVEGRLASAAVAERRLRVQRHRTQEQQQ
jgi:hypothetical protein